MSSLDELTAEVLRPGDAGYDEARRIHNGMVDKRPAVIVRCRSAEDVAAAIANARESGLEVSVRGGGHNVAGRAVCEGGLMVDLSQMKDTDVDPEARTVRAQPGLNWGELNAATQAHGLAVTGGTISTTGIAGLTLGGGFGWLMGKFGFAADNLIAAEVVTADGSILTASDGENPDLFWALRGGGGNFGVVTEFTYQLHPVGPIITGGFNFWPFEAAADVMKLFREMSSQISDDLSLVAALVRSPEEPYPALAGIIACHAGTEEDAERELAPIRAFGEPVVEAIIRKPYSDVNAQYDFGFPDGALNYWKSSFIKNLSDEAIESMIGDFAQCPSRMSILMMEDVHGAATRVPVSATAIPHRAAGFNLLIPSVWLDPAETDANIAWTRQTFDHVQPFLAEGRYVNYLDDDEAQQGPDPVRAAYGVNYERLVEVKTKYDPENVFHLNFNIPSRASR
ncbi:MAG TPA: FAD-binding oxidoreductase [Solirubrobacteraceae bacterium]|jgi:FAD/FMN-containing dehydrogenase